MNQVFTQTRAYHIIMRDKIYIELNVHGELVSGGVVLITFIEIITKIYMQIVHI